MAEGGSLTWAVGVITAPRKNGYYLDRTIESIDRAGFSAPVVFAEPGSVVPDSFKGHVVRRRKQFGDWTNWATGLYELFLSEPKTDYFFMLEDDALLCTGARAYLEYALPRLGDFASLSLYTSSRYYKPNRMRLFHNECRGKNTWSTVTVIMSHASVLRFFSDPDVQKHRFFDIFQVKEGYWNNKASYGRGRTSVTDCVGNTIKDAVIGQWAEKNHLPVYFHTPALAEHIGVESTLTDDDSTPENGRMTRDFVGADFDAAQWVGQPFGVNRFTDPPLL
jgi:hypothetical protein